MRALYLEEKAQLHFQLAKDTPQVLRCFLSPPQIIERVLRSSGILLNRHLGYPAENLP